MMRVLITGGSGFIGVNLVSHLGKSAAGLINLDFHPPVDPGNGPSWRQVDIRDAEQIAREVKAFGPTHIVHLAALATFDATRSDLEATNIDGTVHLLDAVAQHAPNSRVIITSTQYVNGPGAPFDDDCEFHTVNDYGWSKAGAEMATRAAKYDALEWAIVRPTNIWGAFHPRFPLEIWKYIRRGVYMHPGHAPIMRSYGYVGNVCRQMEILLTAPSEKVRHGVFYLTDEPIDSYEFLNHFSLALRGRSLPRVPYPVLKAMALVGDGAQAVGFKVPFRSDRLHRMREPHGARFEGLWSEFGYRPKSLPEAVAETAEWLKRTYPRIYT